MLTLSIGELGELGVKSSQLSLKSSSQALSLLVLVADQLSKSRPLFLTLCNLKYLEGWDKMP